jgi:hypothetical protein
VFKNHFFILIALFVISSCKPVPQGLKLEPLGAPPLFKRAYHEGCESGLAAFGNSYYKTFYKFNKDMSQLDNDLYLNGWQKGYDYCRRYALKWNFKAWDVR